MRYHEPRRNYFSVITFILLLLLIILFYKELLILGVRLYSSIVPSSEADNLLGSYYLKTAKQNQAEADRIYSQSLKKYTEQVDKTDNPTEKAKLDLILGRYYECGRGTTRDIEKAKSFYEEAKKQSQQVDDPELTSQTERALTRVQGSSKENCELSDDPALSNGSFGWLNKWVHKEGGLFQTSEKPETSSAE